MNIGMVFVLVMLALIAALTTLAVRHRKVSGKTLLRTGLIVADFILFAVFFFMATFKAGSTGLGVRLLCCGGVLALATTLIAFGVRWLKWFYYLCLVLLSLIVALFLPSALEEVFSSNFFSRHSNGPLWLLGILIGFVLNPLLIVLIALGVRKISPRPANQ